MKIINLPWIGKNINIIAAPVNVTSPRCCQVRYITIPNYKGKIINEVRLPVNDIEVRRKLMLTNIIPHSTVMFKKKILSTVNQYPQNLVYAQDYGFMLKVIKKFNIIIIPQFLCSCRYHKYQMTADKTIQKEKLNDRRILLNWKKKNFKLNTSINLLLLVEKLKILIKEAIFYYKNLIII